MLHGNDPGAAAQRGNASAHQVTPLLGYLASGEEVHDRYGSHLHDGVLEVLPAALTQIRPDGRSFIVETVDLGEDVGVTTSVVTRPGDTVVFAQRWRREGLTRFVKGREPEPTSQVSVILKTGDHEPGYICLSAWLGGRSQPEPWDPNATEQSVTFWSHHALVWNPEDVVPGTETSTCPW